MAIYSTAGAKLFIGPAMAPGANDFILADFETSPPKSWTEVNPMENLGTFGDAAEAVTFDAINRGRRMKLKGIKDAGTLEVVCGLDYSDTGQIAMRAAEASPNDFAFKIQFNDAPAGSGATPSLRYFVGQVLSASEGLDSANSVMKANFSIGINSNVVRKNASV